MGTVISNGYLIAASQYDNLIYCIGKGPSATTVSAPENAQPVGSPVLIKGTVTDQSPGQTCLGIPAKGTPAISDANMEEWMEYLYEQQAFPTNAVGVKVHLTAIDPNNNFQEIGFATSDTNGNYGLSWTPPVPGTYKVSANFEGSISYGPSSATTYMLIGEKSAAPAVVTPGPSETPTAPVSPTSNPTQPTSPTPSPVIPPSVSAEPITTYLAIGLAIIIIVAAAAALVLRRRK
jgi:hypothetical protein